MPSQLRFWSFVGCPFNGIRPKLQGTPESTPVRSLLKDRLDDSALIAPYRKTPGSVLRLLFRFIGLSILITSPSNRPVTLRALRPRSENWRGLWTLSYYLIRGTRIAIVTLSCAFNGQNSRWRKSTPSSAIVNARRAPRRVDKVTSKGQ